MGLDTDAIPGSDDIMVQSSMVPLSRLIEDYDNPPEPGPDPVPQVPQDGADEAGADKEDTETLDKGLKHHPPYDVVMARSKDISTLIARNRKLAGLERAVASSWRKLTLTYKKFAEREMNKALEQNHIVESAVTQFKEQFEKYMTVDFADESVELIIPRSIQATGEGEVSIEQLVKRLTIDEIKQFSKEPAELLSDASVEFIHQRENLVRGMGERLFNTLIDDLDALVRTGGEVAELGGAVMGMVSKTFNASVNRAVTIARTEIGTAFNVGRVNNMQEQGYAYHEWITNIDEYTRDEPGNDHKNSDGKVRKMGSGELFPSGLAFPQDPTGRPEQVINCRCLTIPLTQEQYDERS
jgi:hypothetical protein